MALVFMPQPEKKQKCACAQPYFVDDTVQWQKKSFEWNGHRYIDDDVETEYNRFVMRDISSGFLGLGWCIGSVVFIAGSVNLNLSAFERGVMWFVFVEWWCLVVADGTLYFVFGYKPFSPRIRRVIHFIHVVNMMILTSFSLAKQEMTCDAAFDSPLDNSTKQQYCHERISQFASAILTSNFITFRFKPVEVTLCIVVYLFLYSIGRHLPDVDLRESAGVIAAKTVALLVCGAICLACNVVRNKLLRGQFEQAITRHVAAKLSRERADGADALLNTMVPGAALPRLLEGRHVEDFSDKATVLFSDIVSFTKWSSSRTSVDVVKMLNHMCIGFDEKALQLDVEKVKTIGDAYWAFSGLPDPKDDDADRVCQLALGMQTYVSEMRLIPAYRDVHMRVGVSTGPLSAAVLGTRQMSYEIFGVTNDIASLCEQKGVPDRVMISQWTRGEITLPVDDQAMPHIVADDGTSFQCYLLVAEPSKRGGMLGPTLGAPPPAKSVRSAKTPGSTMNLTLQQRPTREEDQAAARKYAFFARRERQRIRDEKARGNFDSDDTRTTSSVGTLLQTDMVLQKYTEHASFCGRNLENSDAEAEYMDFAADRYLWFRRATRCGMVGLVLVCLLSLGWDDSAIVSPAAVVLLVLTLLLATATSVICFALSPSRNIVVAECFLQHTTMIMLIVGLRLNVRAVVSNDVTWVGVPLTLLVTLSTSAFSTWGMFLLMLAFNTVPLFVINVLHEQEALMQSNIFALPVNALTYLFLIYVADALLRKQFEEVKMTDHFDLLTAQQTEAQKLLLGCMLPQHVIPALMRSLGLMTFEDDSRPQTARVTNRSDSKRSLHPAINLMVSDEDGEDQTQAARARNAANDILRNEQNVVVLFAKLLAPRVDLAGMDVAEDDPDAPMSLAVDNDILPGGTPMEKGACVAATPPDDEPITTRMRRMHAEVDAVMKPFKSLLKIKSIGEAVLCAGPFTGTNGTAEHAAREALELAKVLQAVMVVQVGINIGPVTTTVLGSCRMSFDLFGDTVNTASRCCSTSPKGMCVASKDIVDFLTTRWTMTTAQRDAHIKFEQARFVELGPYCERPAKGKGVINVSELVFE